MSESREVLAAMQAMSQQLGTIEARLKDVDARMRHLTETVHIGNGRDSVLTRVTRLEDHVAELKQDLRDARKSRKALIGALIAAGLGSGTTIAQLLGAFGQ